jgi:hypothetical protein
MDPFTLLQLGGPPSASERLLGFALGILVGGLALFVSSRFLAEVQGYDHAVLTAVIGALAWALLSPIPLLGPVIALVGWVAVLKWRYPVSWLRAAGVGAAAWAAAVVIVAALELVGVDAISAVGVPGA